MATITFDDKFYKRIIDVNGYAPADFEPVDFNLNGLDAEWLKRKFVCHHNGQRISQGLKNGEKTIISTGFGMSGKPHMGSISQILKITALSNAGVHTQMVLGDLDAYNARKQTLPQVKKYAEGFSAFARSLGYNEQTGVIRDQYQHPEINRTAFLISKYITDDDFEKATEDLADTYKKQGVYNGWSFGMKQSLTLMVADFIHLHIDEGYQNVLVMLGLEEHKYVRLAKTVAERMGLDVNIGGMYGRVIRGLGGFPKMSKSLPGSSIDVGTPDEDIRKTLLSERRISQECRDNAAFQIIEQVSYLDSQALKEVEKIYEKGSDAEWASLVGRYIDDCLLPILSKWPDRTSPTRTVSARPVLGKEEFRI